MSVRYRGVLYVAADEDTCPTGQVKDSWGRCISVDEYHQVHGRCPDYYHQERQSRKCIKTPTLPPKVYHATPHPHAILQHGFEINPERQTFGGHGTYVSVTNKANALKYRDGLRWAIGAVNGQHSWDQLQQHVREQNGGSNRANDNALHNVLFNEAHDWLWRAKESGMSPKHRLYQRAARNYKRLNKGDPATIKYLLDGHTIAGQKLSAKHERKRRWNFIHTVRNFMDFEHMDKLPLFMGSDPPAHWQDVKPEDVHVVESTVQPEQHQLPNAYNVEHHRPAQHAAQHDYYYHPAEEEYRVFDPHGLQPTRIVTE